MRIGDLKIGVRLGLAFGLFNIMMLVMALAGVARFHDIGTINTRIIEKD